MKYIDIPRITRDGSYAVNVHFAYLEKWLGSIVTDGEIVDLDPDFQRGHVWSDAQRSRFVEYMLRGGKYCNRIRWNHPAFTGIGGKGRDLPLSLVIVDGLQRLTACRLFIDNKIRAFGAYLSEYEDAQTLMRHVDLIMEINDLKTRRELLQWYLDLNDGGVAHTQAEIKRVRSLMAAVE